MGGLILENHWNRMVLASLKDFFAAEDYAIDLSTGSNGELAQIAAYEALRRGMVAALFLHHFAEVAINRQHPALSGLNRRQVYDNLSARTLSPDSSPRPDDWKILGEAADAIKHGELTAWHIQHVERNGRVIEWSQASNVPEGRMDDEPQILVGTINGPRPLRALLINIANAWSEWLDLQPL